MWTKTADQILESITRYCTRINESRHWDGAADPCRTLSRTLDPHIRLAPADRCVVAPAALPRLLAAAASHERPAWPRGSSAATLGGSSRRVPSLAWTSLGS